MSDCMSIPPLGVARKRFACCWTRRKVGTGDDPLANNCDHQDYMAISFQVLVGCLKNLTFGTYQTRLHQNRS